MYSGITHHYFNVNFNEIQLKKENLESVFWVPEHWAHKLVCHSPKRPEYVTGGGL